MSNTHFVLQIQGSTVPPLLLGNRMCARARVLNESYFYSLTVWIEMVSMKTEAREFCEFKKCLWKKTNASGVNF